MRQIRFVAVAIATLILLWAVSFFALSESEVQKEMAEKNEHQTLGGKWKEKDTKYEDGKIQWKDEAVYDESSSKLSAVKISTNMGNIEISDSNTDIIRIVAVRRVKATDEERGHDFRQQFQPKIQRKGNTLVIETKMPEKKLPHYIKEAEMSYKVSLPTHLEMTLFTSMGSINVRVSELQSELNAKVDDLSKALESFRKGD